MKFLLVLIVVMVGVWIWRSNRAAERADDAERDAARPRRKAPGAIAMGRCDHCGMHCPSDDLIVGEHGTYCSTEHRNRAEA
jgi:uncharacterized protein